MVHEKRVPLIGTLAPSPLLSEARIDATKDVGTKQQHIGSCQWGVTGSLTQSQGHGCRLL
jgi:hypothetical protein